MTWSSTEAGRRPVIACLLLVLAISCGLRLRGLDHDLAYEITSYSGTFITDEGWYNKSARSVALWGEWSHPIDRNIYSHTSLYVLWMAGVFEIFGVSLEVARANAIAAFFVSLAMLYLICRTRWSVDVSLMACVAVSATLHVVTFSRMAIVEPTGVAVSLAALVLWIKYPARAGVCLASVTLAACAVFLKISFIFTLGVVGLLWLADIATLARQGSWARSRPLMLAVSVTAVAAVLAIFGVRAWAGRDWYEMHARAVHDRAGTAGMHDSLIYLTESVTEFLLEDPERVVLLAAALLLPVLLMRWRPAADRGRPAGRAYLAMTLWATAGFVMFSLFEYRVPRYYYFLIYPLTFLALEGIAVSFRPRHRRAAVAVVLAAHLIAQIPDWARWLDRGPSSSQADMARVVASRITDGTVPPVLLGLNAAFVAFFDDRIRPLELEFVEPLTLCQRIDWWRPPYFLQYESQFPEQLCPEIVRELEPLEYYTVMGRWYYDSEVVLARIVYHRPGTVRLLSSPPNIDHRFDDPIGWISSTRLPKGSRNSNLSKPGIGTPSRISMLWSERISRQ